MRGTVRKDQWEGRELILYLPPSWREHGNGKVYPILFVQDGDYLFEPNIPNLEELFDEGTVPELILAGVEPIDRLHDYTPWPSPGLVAGKPDFQGRGTEYVTYLADRLKPYITAKYHGDPAGGNTGVIGASLGGLVSLYAALTRPEAFGRIGLLSASFWYQGFLQYLEQRLPDVRDAKPIIYMSVGTMEGEGKSTVQKDMTLYTEHAAVLLESCGWGGDRLRFEKEEGGRHLQPWFVRRFPQALAWMYGDFRLVSE